MYPPRDTRDFENDPPRPPRPPAPRDDPEGRYESALNFSKRVYVKIFIISILLLLVGVIFTDGTGYMNAPDIEDYENEDGYLDTEDEKRYENDLESYNNMKKGMSTSGALLKDLSMVLFCMALFIGALIDGKLPDYVRLGMFIALGFVIAFQV